MNFFTFLNNGIFPYQTLTTTNFLIGLFGAAAVGYLLGSVNTAIVVSRLFYHDDVRKHGSGNAGLTNTFRTYGKKAALWTLAGDMIKTVLSVVIFGVLFGFMYTPGALSVSPFCYIAGLFAVLGHCFPAFYKLKGGKGVLVSATLALTLSPLLFVILFAIFVLIVATSKYVSLGSVSAVILYPILLRAYMSFFYGQPLEIFMALTSILIAVIVVFRHWENLKRIGMRTERKFSFKREKHDD
ncbi:MAG: glycerol-3-phosphate 1-O-acyltransferase PlsY [Clostridia bacterium]|nr:glycerol-3-phosphate 1-O-acyltransferase PlsY [Clostridia bacterium]